MNDIMIGYGKSLDAYKTKRIEHNNLDITINLDNGDIILVNTREHGYALRIIEKDKEKKTLIDKDF